MPNNAKTTRRNEGREQAGTWETACTTLLDGNRQVLTWWLQGVRTLSQEVEALFEARLRFATDICSAIGACRNPEDPAHFYRSLASKVTEHCAGEIASLSEMTIRILSTKPGASDS